MRRQLSVDLIINRRARKLQNSPALVDALHEMVRGRARVHTTNSWEELQAVAAGIAASGTDLVLLAGGDGSLMAGVTALCEAFPDDALPAISPIPAGTAGTIARNWGISGRPERCLARVLEGPRKLVQRPAGTASVAAFTTATSLASASRQPRRPQVQRGPAGATGMCASSPTPPRRPVLRAG